MKAAASSLLDPIEELVADRSDSTVTWTGAGPNPGNESVTAR